jgi:peptidyl-prolyl cis-trans isomerase B (cyclophilin B)
MSNDPNQYPPPYQGGYTPPPPGYTPAPGYEQPPQQPYGYAAPPSGYQQGYPQQYAAPMPTGTNGLAIASLILAFVFAPAAIILGHMALSQIKKTGQEGRGLALAGTILGYVFTGFFVLYLCFVVVLIVFAASTPSSGLLPLLAS